ncbi:MAG: hypothetical protein COY58_03010 [Gammaproteobacteria bacterium CG_4_10_14_0_8_um_filter_38_16]|nr:MAG: hypothetical protein COY58_03010 [Gammaproteobacteria bacterium CG_4_10_14_0_8_um_filter_38_16]PJA03898.1 MAG: hypothetical protein COX72_03170 [Gammaproteobacteria bacterium CG_4_10_14_0_2_um_filter_38_22]PJB09567.1 MAG: hypothetical protein CO120_09325 [Gammaproteobacteria bacterium CG_4_9_14_3_um_filter_38_9]
MMDWFSGTKAAADKAAADKATAEKTLLNRQKEAAIFRAEQAEFKATGKLTTHPNLADEASLESGENVAASAKFSYLKAGSKRPMPGLWQSKSQDDTQARVKREVSSEERRYSTVGVVGNRIFMKTKLNPKQSDDMVIVPIPKA